jgi:Rrf2 family iron-sulfur cluster assembly transcriptional regulator
MLMRRERAYTAVAVMLDIGWYAGRQRLESAGDIADRLSMARRGIEPVLQGLARAGLLDSTRGPKGGYRLGKSARQITLAEVVDAVTTGETAEASEIEAGGELQTAAVEPLWLELEEHVQSYLRSITLEALIQRAQSQGLKRPAHAPIVFAI